MVFLTLWKDADPDIPIRKERKPKRSAPNCNCCSGYDLLADNRTHAKKHNQLRQRTEDRLGVAQRGGEHSLRVTRPGSLVVRVDFDDRAELLAADPDVYYLTDHYLNYSTVLVRLSRVTPDVLRDLLGMAHKFVTARRAR
jgi:hypothetical protein